MSSEGQCTATCRDGQQCKARAMHGRTVCIFHATDPEAEAIKAKGRKKGGAAHRKQARLVLDDMPLDSPEDVRAMLAEMVNAVRSTGVVDPKTLSQVAYASGALLRSMEVSLLERRLAILERAASAQGILDTVDIDLLEEAEGVAKT